MYRNYTGCGGKHGLQSRIFDLRRYLIPAVLALPAVVFAAAAVALSGLIIIGGLAAALVAATLAPTPAPTTTASRDDAELHPAIGG